jgi:rare lipoprotein A
METLTAAHRTLPFGTVVRVTNLANSESVDVRVIDRGPFVDGRIIDLSHAAAAAIHLIGPGTGMVRVDIISMPTQDPESNVFTVQAGAFQDRDRAERLRTSLEGRYGWACLVERQGRVAQWRVLVGKQTTIGRANALAHRLRSEVGPAFVVRLDDSALSGATTPRSGQ